MVKRAEIRRYARDVSRQFNPERIILFGSYADGRPDADSDVDLLIVMDHPGRDVDQAFAIRKTIKRSFPLDLVVRTPSELKRRLRQKDTFLTRICTTGKTLYDRRSQRMGK